MRLQRYRRQRCDQEGRKGVLFTSIDSRDPLWQETVFFFLSFLCSNLVCFTVKSDVRTRNIDFQLRCILPIAWRTYSFQLEEVWRASTSVETSWGSKRQMKRARKKSARDLAQEMSTLLSDISHRNRQRVILLSFHICSNLDINTGSWFCSCFCFTTVSYPLCSLSITD